MPSSGDLLEDRSHRRARNRRPRRGLGVSPRTCCEPRSIPVGNSLPALAVRRAQRHSQWSGCRAVPGHAPRLGKPNDRRASETSPSSLQGWTRSAGVPPELRLARTPYRENLQFAGWKRFARFLAAEGRGTTKCCPAELDVSSLATVDTSWRRSSPRPASVASVGSATGRRGLAEAVVRSTSGRS